MLSIFNIFAIVSLFIIFLSVLGVTLYFLYKYDKKIKPLEKKNLFLQELIDNKIGMIIIFDDEKTYFMNKEFKNIFEMKDYPEFNFLQFLLNNEVSGSYDLNDFDSLISNKRYTFKFKNGENAFTADFYFEKMIHQSKNTKLGLGKISDS